ncbi:hypothetical protein [Iamia sp.]|uniref:hypothetical protein n=1 Tax=Iamia sp. TaxID=2722710 RepID=UPI002C2019C5|nr:hypothetical protein [Iamia sp.]HXH56396.1 hypothetical protein [Iamia sp.]
MRRLLAFVLLALALPLLAASTAAAQQYPPTGEGSPPSVEQEADRSDDAGAAPLARTGSEVGLLAGVSVVLLAGGAVAVVASRRRPAHLSV